MPRTIAAAALSLLVIAGGFAAALPEARAAGYPVLPLSESNQFVTNLSAPTLAPGTSGAITFTLRNPMNGPLSSLDFTMEVYAFNAFPGNATGPVPTDGIPAFHGGTPNGTIDAVHVPQLGPGQAYAAPADVAIGVSVPGSAPAGTYAIRTALSFRYAGTDYLLESRGHFTSGEWANATLLGNHTPTLNLSRLGVSGVTPETALAVEANPLAPWLYGLLAVALVLAGAGGYIAFRRISRSSSGARRLGPPQSARTAFGKSRTSDGD